MPRRGITKAEASRLYHQIMSLPRRDRDEMVAALVVDTGHGQGQEKAQRPPKAKKPEPSGTE